MAPPARTQTGTRGNQQRARERTAYRARRRCDTRKARLQQCLSRRETIRPNQFHLHRASCWRVTGCRRLSSPTTCWRGNGSLRCHKPKDPWSGKRRCGALGRGWSGCVCCRDVAHRQPTRGQPRLLSEPRTLLLSRKGRKSEN